MSDSVGTTERKKYLDAAKGWGILMVVFGHITKLGNPIDIWFGAYKLAVFYFVSGYLLAMRQSFRKMSTGEYIKKHAKSLLIPYFGYSAFVMIYNVIVGIMKWKSTTDIVKRFLLQAYMTFSFRGISALWFLPTLFFAQVLFIFVIKSRKEIGGRSHEAVRGHSLLETEGGAEGRRAARRGQSGFNAEPTGILSRPDADV